jgi:MYXO-CTERM domain-containing protein
MVDGSRSAPPPALGDLISPEALAVLEEVGKQAVEQPLHVLMAAAPICLSRHFTRVPWYGWAVTPLLIWREWSQWPSKRWWDPPLDWAFLTLGVVLATWRRRRRPAACPPQAYPRPPSHPLRQK